MGIRESIEKKKVLIVPVVLGLGAVAVAASLWNNHASNQLPSSLERVYYTIDDGKSYFADDLNKDFPFDHGGKQAYRAYVFQCGSGAPFVGAVGRRGQVEAASNAKFANDKSSAPIEIKKPGETKWVPIMGPEGQMLIRGLCPGGAPNAVMVQ